MPPDNKKGNLFAVELPVGWHCAQPVSLFGSLPQEHGLSGVLVQAGKLCFLLVHLAMQVVHAGAILRGA
jgi:hypothetical protein